MPKQTPSFDEMVSTTTTRELVPTEQASPEVAEVDMTSRTYSSAQETAFSSEETTIPRLRLAQSMTPEVQNGQAQPGQWVVIGGEPADEVVIIPIGGGRARERRKGQQGEDEVVCHSKNTFTEPLDSMVGSGDPGIKCSTCPFQLFTEVRGKSVKPECSLIYSYICWDVTHQSMVLFELKSTGLQAAKTLNTVIQTKKLGNFAVRLGSNMVQGPKARYAAPTVAIATASDDDFAMAHALMP